MIREDLHAFNTSTLGFGDIEIKENAFIPKGKLYGIKEGQYPSNWCIYLHPDDLYTFIFKLMGVNDESLKFAAGFAKRRVSKYVDESIAFVCQKNLIGRVFYDVAKNLNIPFNVLFDEVEDVYNRNSHSRLAYQAYERAKARFVSPKNSNPFIPPFQA